MFWIPAAMAAPPTVDLAVGVHPQVRDDRLYSPLRQTGLGAGGEAGVSLDSLTGHHRFVLGFSHVTLRSGPDWTYTTDDGETAERSGSPMNQLDLRWAWGVPVATRPEGFTFRLGGTVATTVEAGSWVYGPGSTFGYLAVFGLGPGAHLQAPTRQGTVAVELWSPLGAWVSRQALALNDDDYMQAISSHGIGDVFRLIGNGGFVNVGSYRSAHLRTAWTLPVGERLSPRLAARLDLVSASDPRPLLAWHTGVETGITWGPR